jgi:death-on-curing protein
VSASSFIRVGQDVVLAIHDAQIAEHGGSPGIRDIGLLESALARPRNLAAYGQPDISDLAAAYAYGLARNHPFIDGNKRVSLAVTETSLELNSRQLEATDADCLRVWLELASGHLTEDELAEWLRSRLV